MTLWRLSDGRRGHDNQTLGLIAALGRLTDIDVHEISVPRGLSTAVALGIGPSVVGRAGRAGLPPPHCCVAAGHATHLPLIAAGLRYRARTVLLMKPSLPRAWFDFCIMPGHDVKSGAKRPSGDHLLLTRGALNRVQSAATRDPRLGLILLGGPSSRHGWCDDALFAQLSTIVDASPHHDWTVATSPRTPAATVERIRRDAPRQARVVLVHDVPADWLPTKLSRCHTAWVSEDSVSMVYEALTAGAAVGLLPVPRKARSRAERVLRGIDQLVDDKLVTAYRDWLGGTDLRAAAGPFDEAARAARWLLPRLQ